MKLLLSKLVALAKEQFPEEINPMKTLAELTQTPVLIKTFKFGKYRGREIADIAREDTGYMKWMQGNMELDEDLAFTLNYYMS